MKVSDHAEKPCPVAKATGQVGDTWTLLILRNALLGSRQFDDFQRQLGLTRHVLAQRLRSLVEMDILKRVPARPGSTRMAYQLTSKGRDLQPVILALANWSNKWLFDDQPLPLSYHHKDCAQATQPTMCCSECGGKLHAGNTAMTMGPQVANIVDQCEHPQDAENLGYPVAFIARAK